MVDKDRPCPQCGHPLWQHWDGDGCIHFSCECPYYKQVLEAMFQRIDSGEKPFGGLYLKKNPRKEINYKLPRRI
jgi:hypothetical protein